MPPKSSTPLMVVLFGYLFGNLDKRLERFEVVRSAVCVVKHPDFLWGHAIRASDFEVSVKDRLY